MALEPRGRAPHGAAEVASALARLGVTPSKGMGQSFLTDPFVADAEAALVETPAGAPVLEIGGGLGLLTEALLRRGVGPLTVIEKDRRLVRHLRATFGSSVTVVEGDALTVPWPTVAACVGNLPFSVGTAILERAWSERVPRLIAMVQREVADRIAAGPGSRAYGRLSIWAALYGTVELFRSVPSTAFHPPPAVEGRILLHTGREGRLPVPEVSGLEKVLHGLFTARRKQLGNLLPRLLSAGEDPADVAERAEWPSDWARRRPETLPPEAFFRLATVLAVRPAAR